MQNNQKQKSIKNISPRHSERTLSFSSPQLQAILKLKQKFQRGIQNTIQVMENLAQSKLPQKCLSHNNNFTLYCQNDQKPLCASCMYQNLTHKTHRVIPLVNCGAELFRDCNKFQKQLDFIVGNMTGLVKHVNEGILKMEKEIPILVYKIQQSYQKLHNFLAERQKQHINQLRYFKQKMKYQHGALSAQLNKIAMYIQQKIDNYSKKSQPEFLLTKRNVYEILKNSAKIIGDQLNVKQQQTEPKLHFEVFRQIQDFMFSKLPNFFIKDSKKYERNTIYTRSAKKISSKSKQNLSYSPVSNNKLQKQLQKSNDKIAKQEKVGKNEKQKQKQSHSKSNRKASKSPIRSDNKRMTQANKKIQMLKTPPKKQRSKSNVTLGIKNSPQKYKSIERDRRQSNSKQKIVKSPQANKFTSRARNQNSRSNKQIYNRR